MKKFLCILFSYLIMWGNALCSPAYHKVLSVKQPNGNLLQIVRMGDEKCAFFRTTDGVPVCQVDGYWLYAEYDAQENQMHPIGGIAQELTDRSSQEKELTTTLKSKLINLNQNLQRGLGVLEEAPVTSKGEVCIPIILVQFVDVKFSAQSTLEFYEAHFNQSNYHTEQYVGSVHDYFVQQSDSLFSPKFDILGIVTMSHNASYYGKNIGGSDSDNSMHLMMEAIDSLISRGVDFSKYIDKTSKVPNVSIIYAGSGEQVSGNANEIWAKCYTSANYRTNGITFASLLEVNELADYTGEGNKSDGIGTYCHEFSHLLGLPDMYNYQTFGLDYWDIMDAGFFTDQAKRPTGYSAYERMFMGWLLPETLSVKKQKVIIRPLAENGKQRSYLIPNPHDDSQNEYLLLENRTNSNWYSSYFGEGMLVYHVDYNKSKWRSNAVNEDANHLRVSIIPADNKLSANSANSADYQGDLYPGITQNTSLSNTSVPAVQAYVGGYFDCSLEKIQQDGPNGDVLFYYMCKGELKAPELLQIDNTQTNLAKVSFQSVEFATQYQISLYQDAQLIKLDTITDLTYDLQGLDMATTYTVKVKAINLEYMDSPESSLTFSTTSTGIKEFFSENKNVRIFDSQGKFVEKCDYTTWKRKGKNPGIYIIRDGNQSYKVYIN